MVPSTLGTCRYISHSEIVCRGPKMFENHCSRSFVSHEVEDCNWSLSLFLCCWSWLVSGNYSWHLTHISY